MPLRSMTGFGQAEKSTPSGIYRVEIRGVNNRYLEIQFRTPKTFSGLEQTAKKLITETLSRGSLTVTIAWDSEDGGTKLTWDRQKVTGYIKILKEVKKEFKLAGDIGLANLLTFSDFIKAKSVEHDEETLWHHIKPVIRKAIDKFQCSRETEAAAIVRQLRAMTAKIVTALDAVEKRAPVRVQAFRETFTKKIESLTGGVIEPQRLATEIAIMADRLDISEECTRLRAHIEKFTGDLDADDPAGKRMTFILQEMNREANTIGSKANDSEISHLSVTMKEIIEQMREQAQNME
jgi:uncharacterized protein (TIGR00255 family)